MSLVQAIAQIGGAETAPQIAQFGLAGAQPLSVNPTVDFDAILSGSLNSVNDKVATADAMVRQFAVDDSIPVHQVTLALEEARLSVELAMQVRARMVETYREFMNMQL